MIKANQDIQKPKMNDNDYLMANTSSKLAENILKRPVPPNSDLSKLKIENIMGVQKKRKHSGRKRDRKSPKHSSRLRHKRNSPNID